MFGSRTYDARAPYFHEFPGRLPTAASTGRYCRKNGESVRKMRRLIQRWMLIPERGLMRPDLHKTEHADADGKFRIAGIAPGKYQIVAVSDYSTGAQFVDVTAGARITVLLR